VARFITPADVEAVREASSKPELGFIVKSTLPPCAVVVAIGLIVPLPFELAVTLNIGAPGIVANVATTV
jgi:hypothetical protein